MAEAMTMKVEIGEPNGRTLSENLSEQSSLNYFPERSETELNIKGEPGDFTDMDSSPIDYSLPSRRTAGHASPSQDVDSHSAAADVKRAYPPELSSAKRNRSLNELGNTEIFGQTSPKSTNDREIMDGQANGMELEEGSQQPDIHQYKLTSSTDDSNSEMSDVDIEDKEAHTDTYAGIYTGTIEETDTYTGTFTGIYTGTDKQNNTKTEQMNPEEARKFLESMVKQVRKGRRPKESRGRIKFSDCPQCKKTFSSFKSLRRHIQDIHMNDPQQHRCTQCDKSFKAKSYLYGHIQRVHAKNSNGEDGSVEKIEVKPRAVNPNREPYNCTMCEASFVNKHGLVDHIKIVHEEKPYECNYCDKRFTQSGSLSSHMRSVHCGEKRYSCDQCGFKFSQKSNLATHKRNIHEGLKSFHCSECDYKASTKGHLDRHWKAVHVKEKRFPCFECGKAFSCKEGLRIHIDSVHRKYRPFMCEECFKSFPRSIDLKQHVDAVHNGIKPYPCIICGMCFSQNCNLTRHMNAMHGGAVSGLLDEPSDSLNPSNSLINQPYCPSDQPDSSINQSVSEYLGQINQSIDDYLASDSSMRDGESDDQTDEFTSDRLETDFSSEGKPESETNPIASNSQMSVSIDEESGEQINSFICKSTDQIKPLIPEPEGQINALINLESVSYIRGDESNGQKYSSTNEQLASSFSTSTDCIGDHFQS